MATNSMNGTLLQSLRQRKISAVLFLVASVVLLVSQASAGIRGPGKYSGVVIFDRWDGCILFSGVYLMYVSEAVKERLRPYEGHAIELDALDVAQPVNPGDGLIRELRVIGPAPPNNVPFSFREIKLDAQPIALKGERAAIELTVINEGAMPAKIDSSQIGFVLLSEKTPGKLTPSDGPSTAVITRSNVLTGSRIGSPYSYFISEDVRLPRTFALAPHQSRSTQIRFQLPPGHYQFFAGYGGGVHEAELDVSNHVSIDLW